MSFLLGCAVWAYKEWVGNFYPPKSRPSEFLRLYSQRFKAVEGNTTFYVIPTTSALARWKAETPSGFKFCFKLPKEITHNGLLTPRIAAASSFLAIMSGLADRLGPIFAQLPPGYGPDLFSDLEAFLTAWQQDIVPLALEVRHPAWFSEPHAGNLERLLQRLGVGRVLLDSRPVYDAIDDPYAPSNDPQLHSERRKPKLPLPLSVTSTFSIIRYISHPERAFNQTYLEAWAAQLATWLAQGIDVYFFVHCPQEARSPHNAYYFQQLLEAQNVPVPPLSWQFSQPSVPPTTQLNLFD
ncbi:DUF72 domain-containing protein [Pseudanabaena sp. PCC 6802]|uniref:DUF72 domain-containing protein n=1 Tax=Pseudanabaena sp. PCC 6802 TaxID=118173 RepID=UPI0003485F2F|nr:DUF72 domain-containing protein [Pseudanabaena sp. PCC 6802]